MKTLLTRSISGLIFVSVVLLSLLLSKNYLVLLFAAVSGICFYEFHKMFKSDKLLNFNPIISGIIASIGFLISVNHYMPIPIFEFSEDFGKYGLLSMMTILICIQLLFQAKNAFSNIALILLGTVYILIPLIPLIPTGNLYSSVSGIFLFMKLALYFGLKIKFKIN